MKRELIGALVWAGAMLALTFGATVAHRLGYIDRGVVTRLLTGVIGLWIVWNGNRIPKKVVPSARAGQAQRVAGWSLVLSGLAFAALWAFAPIPVAAWWGSLAVLAGVAITFGYCLSLRPRAKAG
jgi:hypothetical protein